MLRLGRYVTMTMTNDERSDEWFGSHSRSVSGEGGNGDHATQGTGKGAVAAERKARCGSRGSSFTNIVWHKVVRACGWRRIVGRREAKTRTMRMAGLFYWTAVISAGLSWGWVLTAFALHQ